MSSSHQGALRTGGRLAGFIQRWALAFGVVLALGAIAILYLTKDASFEAARLFGFHPREIALGMAGLAAVIVAVNIASALWVPTLQLGLHDGIRAGRSAPAASLADELAPYRGELLKLSEPKPAGAEAEIMLLDAVRLAFSESRGTAAAAFATTFANSPDDVVTSYATFFAEHIPVYGCQLSSSASERVFLNAPPKEFDVEDGILVLRERNGPVIYDRLSIKAADYALVLERLHSPP